MSVIIKSSVFVPLSRLRKYGGFRVDRCGITSEGDFYKGQFLGFDTILAEFAPEGAAMDAEFGSGLGAVAVVAAEAFSDHRLR